MRASGASWSLVPPCSPGCGSTEMSAGLSQRQTRKHFICKSSGSFVHSAGMREFRWRSTCCSYIHCNFPTIRIWKTDDFHSGRFRLSFAHQVKSCFGGFSSPTVNIINPIASWWQVRVQGQTVPQPHQRYLVNRVGSKYLRKCTIKETNVNFFSATVLTALGFRSLRVC